MREKGLIEIKEIFQNIGPRQVEKGLIEIKDMKSENSTPTYSTKINHGYEYKINTTNIPFNDGCNKYHRYSLPPLPCKYLTLTFIHPCKWPWIVIPKPWSLQLSTPFQFLPESDARLCLTFCTLCRSSFQVLTA